MIPFKDSYYSNKIDEFLHKSKLSRDKKLGEVEVELEFMRRGRIQGYMHNYRGDLFNIPKLKCNGEFIMELNPTEIGGYFEFIRRASGTVGVVGLGLGYLVSELALKDRVKDVVVFEKEKDIIRFYEDNFGSNEKIKVIHGDAFSIKEEFKSKKFNFFFVDIYNEEVSSKVMKDYKFFKEVYYIEEYAFFGVEHFILSLDSHALENDRIPKNWLHMADNLGDRFYQSPYRENFVPLNYKLCKSVLEEL